MTIDKARKYAIYSFVFSIMSFIICPWWKIFGISNLIQMAISNRNMFDVFEERPWMFAAMLIVSIIVCIMGIVYAVKAKRLDPNEKKGIRKFGFGFSVFNTVNNILPIIPVMWFLVVINTIITMRFGPDASLL